MSRYRSRLSLRMRLLLWQLVVMGPLLLAAVFHHFYLMPGFIVPMNKVANEISNEVLQVKDLQSILSKATMSVHDYLIHGEHSEIAAFNRQRESVKAAFTETNSIPFGETYQQQLVDSAWQEWQQAEQIGVEILSVPEPVARPALAKKMQTFDSHIDAASVSLEELYKQASTEIKQAQKEVNTARSRSQNLTVAAFVFAVLLSLFLGSRLTRSILLCIMSLRTAARQIAAGKLENEVHACEIDELEELAGAFNNMTLKLQAHDVALQELTQHDELTGLENRRALNVVIREELYRAKRYQHPLSLLMLDIDHFKHVNDTYGHVAGDAVLRQLASIIKSLVRPVDHVFRYGGEEFVVLIPETNLAGAVSLAQRIREVIEVTPCSNNLQKDINITISLGAATYPEDVDTSEALITAADHAMYQAKQTGRNRVCVYNQSVKTK